MLKRTAAVLPPASLPTNREFLRPMAIRFISRSATGTRAGSPGGNRRHVRLAGVCVWRAGCVGVRLAGVCGVCDRPGSSSLRNPMRWVWGLLAQSFGGELCATP
jgi:hypothetical protein